MYCRNRMFYENTKLNEVAQMHFCFRECFSNFLRNGFFTIAFLKKGIGAVRLQSFFNDLRFDILKLVTHSLNEFLYALPYACCRTSMVIYEY
jgi:hypothetical protein